MRRVLSSQELFRALELPSWHLEAGTHSLFVTETEQPSTNTHRSVKLEFLSEEPQLHFASPTVNSTEVSWLGELERMTQLYLAAGSHGMPLSGKQKSTIGNKLIYSFKKRGDLLIPIHSPMISWSYNFSYKLGPFQCPGLPLQIGSGKEPPRKDSEADNEVPKAQRQSVIQVLVDTYTTLAVRSAPNSVT